MDTKQMRQQLESCIGQFGGQVAYRYQRLTDETAPFSYASSATVVSASTIKVPIAIAVLTKVEKEGLDTETFSLNVSDQDILSDSIAFETGPRLTSIHELLYWMITVSDNTSTNVLIDWCGIGAIDDFFGRYGLKDTSLQRHMLDFEAVKAGYNNYISIDDYFHCFMDLESGRILNDQHRKLLLDILKENRDSKEIKRYLYQGCPIAHKTGELDDVSHDGGIIYNGNHPYFLAVFVSNLVASNETSLAADQLIGRMSRLFMDYDNSRTD